MTTATKANQVCDSCSDAFYDYFGPYAGPPATADDDGPFLVAMSDFLVEMGGDISDHICERIEDPESECACGCNARR